MEIDHNGLEVLGREECLRLLRGATVGRIGVTVGALPSVLPVGYWVAGERIAFRTSPRARLSVATDDAVVAFEVDDIDPATGDGWSVVVTGVARHVGSDGRPDEGAGATPWWLPDGDGCHVEITADVLTGRRTVPGGPSPFTLGGRATPGSSR